MFRCLSERDWVLGSIIGVYVLTFPGHPAKSLTYLLLDVRLPKVCYIRLSKGYRVILFNLIAHVSADFMEVTRTQFPKVVRIETTNHCNAECTFCPRESIGRDKTFMDRDLFDKIIDQCVAGGTRMIHMHNFGEPLLDKRIPDLVRHAKDKGIPRIKLFSNGHLLRDKMAERLLDSGLDEIKVSLDGANSDEFNELRIGLDHETVLNNTREFRELRNRRGLLYPKVVAACVTSSDKKQTEQLLEGVVDHIDWSSLHNWAGKRRWVGDRKVRKPCGRLWRTLSILVNGDVAQCCLDHSGQEILGNVGDQKISDIWNNQRYNELRKLHRKSQQDQISLCDNCTKCYL